MPTLHLTQIVYCDLLQKALDKSVHAMAPAHFEAGAVAQSSRRISFPWGIGMEIGDLASHDDATLKALGLILDAWEEGADKGVAPELMAYAALYAAFTDLVAAFGEDTVSEMARGLATRVKAGEFTLYSTRQ